MMHGNIKRDIGEWEIERRLGSGSFAVVWKAVHKTTRETAAIKEVDTERLNDALKERLREELEISRTIKHENIVEFKDAIREPERLFLIMEYCNRGDLYNLMQRQRRLTEDNARHFLRQLVLGLRELRLRNLIHRDLKPQNLLLSKGNDVEMEKYVLKIADFGFARNLQPRNLAETLCGSPLYMAPEILRSEKYDAKADLWSVGVILYEMLVGKPPFDGQNHIHLSQNIERGTVEIPTAIKVGLSESCKDLIYRLLVKTPSKRVSFKEFFDHPFFKEGRNNGAVLNSSGLDNDFVVKELQLNNNLNISKNLETVTELSEACWICTESQDGEFLRQKIKELEPVVEDDIRNIKANNTTAATAVGNIGGSTLADEMGFVVVENEEVLAVSNKMAAAVLPEIVGRRTKVECNVELLDDVAFLISEFADSKRDVGLEMDAFAAYYLAMQLSDTATKKKLRLEQSEDIHMRTNVLTLASSLKEIGKRMCGLYILPNIYGMLFMHALAFGRGGASEELMGNYERSRQLYSNACLLLHFLSDTAMSLDLDPPAIFSETDLNRMVAYSNRIIVRRKACSSLVH